MGREPCIFGQPDCRSCHVFKHTDWQVLEGADLAALSDGVTRREYQPGEAVYSAGEPNRGIYCISGGALGIKKTDAEGNAILVHLAYPGETLGYRSFLQGGEHKTTAEAFEPSFVCHIKSDAVRRILGHNPKLGLQFLGRATRELEEAHEAMLQSSTLSNRARFIHLLALLLRRHGRRGPDGSGSIHLPLNRRDLAGMIGTRHETLSRIIGRLEAEGLANFSGREVHVANIGALLGEIGADAPPC